MNRRHRFLLGLIFLTSLFALPIATTASIHAFQWVAILLACYSLGVYQIYCMTIKNIKLKYPLVNPEGHPDIYSGRMPRPIYEDVKRYTWFFHKSKAVKKTEKIRKKGHNIKQ